MHDFIIHLFIYYVDRLCKICCFFNLIFKFFFVIEF